MSGIFGIVHSDGAPIDEALLQSATQGMAWRGPDKQQHWSAPGIGLGHALLRTTWESAREEQPFYFEERFWVVADARIDARGELLDRLRTQYRSLASDVPDVELIAHAYAMWGEDCLDYLIGDFAFAIWDAKEKSLFCARDQFGVTPFYYCHQGKRLLFGNTLRTLRACSNVSAEINELAVIDYLLSGCNQDAETTWFRDIRSLPPAHVLVFKNNSLMTRRYWNLDFSKERLHYADSKEYAEHFGTLFEQAVLDRLRTDEVISSMSGGLDSSSVTGVAHRAYQRGASATRITAYSIGFDWLIPDDERVYAALIAEKNQIPVHYLSAEKYVVVNDLERAWKKTTEPRFSSRPFPAWEINDIAASQGVRVTLSGYGGDPLLQLKWDHWERLLDERNYQTLLHDTNAFRAVYGVYPPLRLRSRLTGSKRRQAKKNNGPEPKFERFNVDFARKWNLPERAKELGTKMGRKDDRVGMTDLPFWANVLSSTDPDITSLPVKVRHPFFDVRLLQYVVRIPPIPWLLEKNLLRASMQDVLPERVLTRPKTFLRASMFRELITRGYEPWAPDLLAVPELEQYINVSYMNSLLESPEKLASINCEKMFFYPLGLAYWLQQQQGKAT